MDESRCELICLYVKEYKCFKNVIINLSSRYNSELCGAYGTSGVVTVKIRNNSKKFERSNKDFFTLLCGKNGTGKTTILELLVRPTNSVGIYKSGNNFYCHGDESLVDVEYNGYTRLYSKLPKELAPFDFDQRTAENNFNKNFIDFYAKEPILFQLDGESLYSHFTLRLYDQDLGMPQESYISNLLSSMLKNSFRRQSQKLTSPSSWP